MRRVFLLTTLLAAGLAAADLTGKWNGTVEFKGPDGSQTGGAFMELKQQGNEVTGQAGPNEGDLVPISNVKFDGKRLAFEVVGPEGRVFKLALEIAGEGKLEGTVNGETDSGDKVTGKITFQKNP